MKFRIEQKKLMTALSNSGPYVSKKSMLSINSMIKLSANANSLKLHANNTRMGFGAVLEADVETSGEILVDWSRLMDILSSMPKDCTIEISVQSSSDKLTIKAVGDKKMSARIRVLSADKFEEADDPSKDCTIELSSTDVIPMIEKTVFCTGKDESRIFLTGVRIEPGKDMVEAVATDGKRLSLLTIPCNTTISPGKNPFDQNNGIIIPTSFLESLMKIALEEKDPKIVLVTDGSHISADIGNYHLSSLLITGLYPNWKRVIPKAFNVAVEFDKDTTQELLVLIAKTGDRKNRKMMLKIPDADDGTCMIKACSESDGDDAEVEIPGTLTRTGGEKKDMLIGVNSDFFLENIHKCEKGTVKLLVNNTTTAIGLKDSSGEGNMMIMMPMQN